MLATNVSRDELITTEGLKEHQVSPPSVVDAQYCFGRSNGSDIQPSESNKTKNFVTSFDETDEFFTPEEGERNLFDFLDDIIRQREHA